MSVAQVLGAIRRQTTRTGESCPRVLFAGKLLEVARHSRSQAHYHWVAGAKRWMRDRLKLEDTGPAQYARSLGVCIDHDRQLLVYTSDFRFRHAVFCESFHFGELPVSPDVDHRAKHKTVIFAQRSITGNPGVPPIKCPGEGSKPRLELIEG